MGRRGSIGRLGLVVAALVGGSESLRAFGVPSGSPKVSAPARLPAIRQTVVPVLESYDLPEQWVRDQGPALPEYARYLAGLRLKAITPSHVIEAHAKVRGPVWNCLPPKKWWTRMGYTLRVADRIALEMGVHEVEVVSCFRQPAYNARCPGAKSGSWHQANVAVDVKFPVQASKVTATARNLRDRGLFRGGIGGYWNFTHIDTRGENVNW